MQADARIGDLARAVADGEAVNWAVEDSRVSSAEDKGVVAQLRVLSALAQLHRDSAIPAATPDSVSLLPAAAIPSPLETLPWDPSTTVTGSSRNDWKHLEIIALVGQGSFGAVYRAWDRRLDREVALKLLHRGDQDSSGKSSIIDEGRVLARVRHPNVITIYGADYGPGTVGLWMEYIHGSTLKQIVADRGVFGAREAALIGVDLARALAAVHAVGLVHRDVKAQNVMREQGGRVVLMDFGTGTEANSPDQPSPMAGTPLYMAPELFDDATASARSDLYSLGVLLFFLVTGSYPVTGKTMREIVAAHRSGQRRMIRDLRPEVPSAFVQVVERLLDRDPASRFHTAGEAEQALERAVGVARPTPRTRSRWVAAGVFAVVIAALALGSWLRDRIPGAGGSPVRSLVVLPMANLSGDASLEYFSDGLTELLIAELSRAADLRVTSRTSAMVYKSGGKSVPQIASELGVNAVLEASMVRLGDLLRITASLRRSDETRLWSRTYDASLVDTPILQAQIASEIAASLGIDLPPELPGAVSRRYSAQQSAQDLYLRGRYLMHQANRERMREACESFEQAVTMDPRYGLAWASLARCRVLREAYGDLTPAVANTLVNEAAGRAIAEDPSLAEAHLAWAEAKFKFAWDWVGARESYVQALAIDPSFSHGRTQYARFLSAAGLLDEATAQAEHAERVDPLAPEVKATTAMMLFYQRRYDEAVAVSELALALNPRIGHTVRGRALAALGRFEDSVEALNQAVTLSGRNPLVIAELGRVYAAAGMRPQAEEILANLIIQRAQPGGAASLNEGIASLQLALGSRDDALALLERAVADRVAGVLWLRVDPRLDELRNEPRFAMLIDRIGGLP